MSNTLGMAAQLAGESLRFGWYFALNRVVEWRTSQLGLARRYTPSRPVPSMQELLADQAQLLMSDALAVRDGLYPPMEEEAGSSVRHLFRVASGLSGRFALFPGTASITRFSLSPGNTSACQLYP
jgi:hypothetical protein